MSDVKTSTQYGSILVAAKPQLRAAATYLWQAYGVSENVPERSRYITQETAAARVALDPRVFLGRVDKQALLAITFYVPSWLSLKMAFPCCVWWVCFAFNVSRCREIIAHVS